VARRRPGLRAQLLAVLLAYGGGWWVAEGQHFGAPSEHGQPSPVLYWLRGATLTLPLTATLVTLLTAVVLGPSGRWSSAPRMGGWVGQLLVVLALAAAGGLAVGLTELVSLRMFFGLHGDPGPPPVWLLLRDGLQAFRADLLITGAVLTLHPLVNRSNPNEGPNPNEESTHAHPTQRDHARPGDRWGDPAPGGTTDPAGQGGRADDTRDHPVRS
jgi:hypothetical protein